MSSRYDHLVLAISHIQETLINILNEADVEVVDLPHTLTDVLNQTIAAIGLGRSGLIDEPMKHPSEFLCFMSFTKITNILEYMHVAEMTEGIITKESIERAMYNDLLHDYVSEQIGREIAITNFETWMNQALPLIIEMGGARQVTTYSYELTPRGEQAAKLWIEYCAEENRRKAH